MEKSPFDFSKKLTEEDGKKLQEILKSKRVDNYIYLSAFFPGSEKMKIGKALNGVFKFGKCNRISFFYDSKKDCNDAIYNYLLNKDNIQEKVKLLVLQRIKTLINEKFDSLLEEMIEESEKHKWDIDFLPDYKSKVKKYIEFYMNKYLDYYGLFDFQTYVIATYLDKELNVYGYKEFYMSPYFMNQVKKGIFEDEEKIKKDESENENEEEGNEDEENNSDLDNSDDDSSNNIIQKHQRMFKEMSSLIKNQQKQINELTTTIKGLTDRYNKLKETTDSRIKSVYNEIDRVRRNAHH